MSADYGLPPTPNTSLPGPTYKEQESLAYSKAHVDTEDLRDGCPGMSVADGYGGDYSYVAIDTAPDRAG
jgi:hypothetical protein